MLRSFTLTFAAIISSFVLQAQQSLIPVVYYFSTGEFMEDKRSTDSILLQVKKMEEDYIYVYDFLDPQTKKKMNDGDKIWAFRYLDQVYVHLKYSANAYSPKLFIRLDLTGRFCAALMRPDFDKVLSEDWMSNRMEIGGMNHPYDNSVGAYFKDEAGLDRRIFLVDTKDLSIVLPYKAKNAPVEMIGKSTLKWLTGDAYKGSVKDYSANEVIQIIEDLNGRQ